METSETEAGVLIMPQTGTKYLSSSHFKLGQEPQLMAQKDPLAYCSTTKRDYPPQPILPCEHITLPPPAKIMQQSEVTNESYCSITKDHYVPKMLIGQEYPNSTKTLMKTNFKLDSDKSIESFRTTHVDSYPPLKHPELLKKGLKQSSSTLLQGDRSKVTLPGSNYRENFMNPCLHERERIINPLFKKTDPLGKDDKFTDGIPYLTSNEESYTRKIGRRCVVPYNVKYPLTNIPTGDRERLRERLTVQQSSYVPVDVKDATRTMTFQKSANLKFGDERNFDFTSTAQNAFQRPTEIERAVPIIPVLASSSLPGGDRDSLRSFERVCSTVQKEAFLPPPDGSGSSRVDGSKIRFRSNVHLGGDDRENFFESTHTRIYQRKPIHGRATPFNNPQSSIPLDYYANFFDEATYKSDFRNKDFSKKPLPNPEAIRELKNSHIRLPLNTDFDFKTTHQLSYMPKRRLSSGPVDSGRLQRSSIAMGTLTG